MSIYHVNCVCQARSSVQGYPAMGGGERVLKAISCSKMEVKPSSKAATTRQTSLL